MIQRLCQTWNAVTATVTEEDRAFVARHLSRREQRPFWAMSVGDQRHSLNVAYTALEIAARRGVREDLLVQCCLLHDVGRVRGDLSTFDKIFAVLVNAAFPEFARRWAAFGKGGAVRNLRHALYIYDHHAERSKDKLLALGLAEAAEIVSKHHKAPEDNDPPELVVLKEADERN